MSEFLRIAVAEAMFHGVLKVTWNDGYQGVVDLRGLIAEGDIFEHIRDPANFARVRVESYGQLIYWGSEGAEEVDFGCDRLREIAEQQASVLVRAN